MSESTTHNAWHERPVLIAGAGSGLGAALARRFARAGVPVAAMARSAEPLEDLVESVRRDTGGRIEAFPGDCCSEKSVEKTVAAIRNWARPPGSLVYNASGGGWSGLLDGTAEEFEKAWRTTHGAWICARACAPAMIEHGGGPLFFTGATSSVRGRRGAVGFSSAKHGLRGLVRAIAPELWPRGVHAAHFIIDGVIDTDHELPPGEEGPADDPLLRPADIAESYWTVAHQRPSAWSLEIDLRPKSEAFFD